MKKKILLMVLLLLFIILSASAEQVNGTYTLHSNVSFQMTPWSGGSKVALKFSTLNVHFNYLYPIKPYALKFNQGLNNTLVIIRNISQPSLAAILGRMEARVFINDVELNSFGLYELEYPNILDTTRNLRNTNLRIEFYIVPDNQHYMVFGNEYEILHLNDEATASMWFWTGCLTNAQYVIGNAIKFNGQNSVKLIDGLPGLIDGKLENIPYGEYIRPNPKLTIYKMDNPSLNNRIAIPIAYLAGYWESIVDDANVVITITPSLGDVYTLKHEGNNNDAIPYVLYFNNIPIDPLNNSFLKELTKQNTVGRPEVFGELSAKLDISTYLLNSKRSGTYTETIYIGISLVE